MGRVHGKVAMITGAARGQGRAHAVALAREGARIVATDLCRQLPEVPYLLATADDLAETARLVAEEGQPCLTFEADARDLARTREVVAEAVAELGRLDTVVVNHGLGLFHSVDQDDTDLIFDTTIETNLSAVWRTALATLPELRRAGGGTITVISSAAGLNPCYGSPAYVAAKHGIIGLVRALACDLAAAGIRVNAVCPTNVATPMIHNPFMLSIFSGGNPEATVDDMVWPSTATNVLPIPWVQPEDVAHAVVFLSSDEARYITGIALPVDAGMSIQPAGVPPLVSERLAELEALRPT